MRDLISVENVIMGNSLYLATDGPTLFGKELFYMSFAKDLPNLLVELKIFKTTSEARRANRTGPIPKGWTHNFKASKKRRLWIWNPSE